MKSPQDVVASWAATAASPPPPVAVPAAPPVPAVPPVQADRLAGQDYRENGGQQRAATLENVYAVLEAVPGLRIVHDTFQDAIMLGDPKRPDRYRPLKTVDYGELRRQMGSKGFKPISVEIMRTSVMMVAAKHEFDSAIAWVESLTWDGIPRIDTVMPTYFATKDTPYTRAVGAYLFTALAGRALVHPLQADMAVILVGSQGARKTTAVMNLAPTPAAYGEIDLTQINDDLARRLKGKLVVEWAEMRGLAGRDQDEIKAWLSRRTEQWIPKYEEFAHSFDRRCIVIGTANRRELLHDETGERRMLPVEVGTVDAAAIERDREQLWAEGAVRFKANGVEWQQAETLARAEHGGFKVYDEWETAVLRWLAAMPVPVLGEVPSPVPNGDRPFALLDLFRGALRMEPREVSVRETRRIGKILRRIGYEARTVGSGADSARRWQRIGSDA